MLKDFFNTNEGILAKEIFFSSIIFIMIALAAFGLQLFVEFIDEHGAHDYLVIGLSITEAVLFVADIVYFIFNVIHSIYKAMRRAISER